MKRTVSVVVASGAGGEFLFRALDSLVPQAREAGAEVLVADRLGGETAERVERDYPDVRLLRAELGHRPSVPELRKLAVLEARGDIAAILEEHCVAPPGWLAAIRESFTDGDAALGGPILDDGYDRIRDWVVYLSEYSNYLPPWAAGERYELNGANIAYSRELLLLHQDVLDKGYWEVVLHPRLARLGRFRSVPAMGVRHTGPFDFGYYLRQRYLLSRVWGGGRRETASAGRRLVYLLLAPLLPAVLLARTGLRVLRSGRHLGKFLAAAPLLVPVFAAYAWGEWLGYLCGTGHALEEVE